MTHRGTQAVVAKAAHGAQITHANLLNDMQSAAAQLAERNILERKRQRRLAVMGKRSFRIRTQTAVRGLNALCNIGASEEFQSLIAAHGAPIIIWGGSKGSSPGGDMVDTYWEYIGVIMLGAASLRIAQCVKTNGSMLSLPREYFFATVPYAVEDNFLRSRLLSKITTAMAMDSKDMHADPYTTEAIFEVLIECADPERLESYIRECIT